MDQIRSHTVISSALAIINGLVLSFVDIDFFGISQVVYLLAVTLLNLILLTPLLKSSSPVLKDPWVRSFAAYVVYYLLVSIVFMILNSWFDEGGYNLSNMIGIFRQNVVWFVYLYSLWCFSKIYDYRRLVYNIILTWIVLNFGYSILEILAGGAINDGFHSQVVAAFSRIRLLGYEPSYSGYMVMLMIFLLVFQIRTFTKFYKLLILYSIVVFVLIGSKGALVAAILSLVIVAIIQVFRLLAYRRLNLGVVTKLIMLLGIICGGYYAVLDNKKLLDLKFNVVNPILQSESGRRAMVTHSDYRSGSFATRYASLLTSYRIFIENPIFGVGPGLGPVHFHQEMSRSRFYSKEMTSSYIGARTSKSFVIQHLVDGGIIGFFLLLRVFHVSFKEGWADLGLKRRTGITLFIVFFLLGMMLTERVPFLLVALLYYLIQRSSNVVRCENA
jgi:hypothetical protein